MSKELLSVVLPSYNEERNIPLVYAELLDNIDAKRFTYEIIFVNDGSTDNTWAGICGLASKDPHVRGINFSRNFGHAAALEAGLIRAKGDIVIMMDSDLQHPPALIPEIIKKYDEGYDIVNTVRRDAKDTGFFKKITSRGFYKFISSISDLKLNEGEADYRLLSRKALDALNALPESPKFYRGLVNWIGFNIGRVGYEVRSRRHGKSSYTLKKMLELARLGVTSFSMKPLKLIFFVGVCMTVISIVLFFVMLFIKLFINPELVSYNAILTDVLLFVAGLLTIFQGVIAIYLVDIFNTTKGRPTYLIGGQTNEADTSHEATR